MMLEQGLCAYSTVCIYTVYVLVHGVYVSRLYSFLLTPLSANQPRVQTEAARTQLEKGARF
jgi:hypothetical protein